MAFHPMHTSISRVSALRVVLTLLIILSSECNAQFGRKKRAQAKKEAELETERLSKLVVIFGLFGVSKSVFYSLTSFVAIGGVAVFLLLPAAGGGREGGVPRKEQRGNRPDVEGTLDVVIVGCGLPKKGMGWFHLTQLLEMERVNVKAVVEPFFRNPLLCQTPPESWTELMTSLTDIGVQVVASVEELTPIIGTTTSNNKKTMCLIAGRTLDNPKLFHDCVIQYGAKFIYLEKPGAPTVEALIEMQQVAKTHNVKVVIGYNKNVTHYIQQTVALANDTKNAHVFLCHNNSYTQSDLPQVFSRNPEGLLKNMAIQDLALLVTYFNVTVDKIEKFKVNTSKLFSEKVSVWKPGTSLPNPEYITDFSRCAFKITLAAAAGDKQQQQHVSVMADRCGGNVSFAVVKDETGKEVKRFEFPTPAEQRVLEEQVASDPAMMPYFFVHRLDYWELKSRVVTAFLNNGTDPEGVATIQVGIEALKLAEYATEALNKALKAK